MSQKELDSLSAEERALMAQLSAVREKKETLARQESARIAEEKRLKELEKIIIITVKDLEGAMVRISGSDYRKDVSDLILSCNGYTRTGNNHNLITVKDWIELGSKLALLPNVSVVYNKGVEYLIDRLLNAPKWFVEWNREIGFTLTAGPNVDTWVLTNPNSGVQWKSSPDYKESEKKYIVPTGLGWRLPDVFTIKPMAKYNYITHTYDKVEPFPMEGIVYTPESHEQILKQIETRGHLDQLTQETEVTWINEFLQKMDNWNGVLKPFQTVGVQFAYEAFKAGEQGVLNGDEMGLGKTWESIALAMLMGAKRILIVCPASLKPNWEKEIKARTGETATVLNGGDPNAWAVQMIVNPKKFTIMNYDILGKKIVENIIKGDGWAEEVTSWPVVEFLKMFEFDICIMDEAHKIRNTTSNRSQATMKFAAEGKVKFFYPMTGTPIHNRPKELFPILNIIAPGEFGSNEKFQDKYSDGPRGVKNVDELHELIKPYFFRRRKKDVYKDLPPKNRITEYHDLSPKARKKYDKIMSGVYESLAEFDPMGIGGDEMNIISFLAQMVRCKQVCAADKIERVADMAKEIYDATDEDSEHRKVIIFTQYKGPARKIAQLLGSECLCTVQKVIKTTKRGGKIVKFDSLDVNERFKLTEQFQIDPNIHFIVLTTGTATEGLNLTAAGTVIFNDFMWTPAAHEQGEDRAYGRINDMHSIDVRFLATENSIEEDIVRMLIEKAAMIEATVDGVEQSRIRDTNIVKELLKKVKAQMWIKKG